MSDKGLAVLTRELFDRLMELRPVEATYFGLHEHDARLPEGGIEDVRTQIGLLRRYGDAVEAEAAPGSLEGDVARYFVRLSLYQAEELRLWASMADAPDQLGNGIFLLFARDFAPLEDRLQAIAARLEDAPRYLLRSRERLTEPVRLWNQVAVESARQRPGLIQVILAAAAGTSLERRLRRAADAAGEALEDFGQWVEEEVLPRSRDIHGRGEDRFTRLLEHRRLPLGHRHVRQPHGTIRR